MAKEEEGVIEHELLPRDQFFVVANEESLCLRSEEEVADDQLLDQDGSSSSKKVMVEYSMITRWICSCVPRLSFDGCLLNQQNLL